MALVTNCSCTPPHSVSSVIERGRGDRAGSGNLRGIRCGGDGAGIITGCKGGSAGGGGDGGIGGGGRGGGIAGGSGGGSGCDGRGGGTDGGDGGTDGIGAAGGVGGLHRGMVCTENKDILWWMRQFETA